MELAFVPEGAGGAWHQQPITWQRLVNGSDAAVILSPAANKPLLPAFSAEGALLTRTKSAQQWFSQLPDETARAIMHTRKSMLRENQLHVAALAMPAVNTVLRPGRRYNLNAGGVGGPGRTKAGSQQATPELPQFVPVASSWQPTNASTTTHMSSPWNQQSGNAGQGGAAQGTAVQGQQQQQGHLAPAQPLLAPQPDLPPPLHIAAAQRQEQNAKASSSRCPAFCRPKNAQTGAVPPQQLQQQQQQQAAAAGPGQQQPPGAAPATQGQEGPEGTEAAAQQQPRQGFLARVFRRKPNPGAEVPLAPPPPQSAPLQPGGPQPSGMPVPANPAMTPSQPQQGLPNAAGFTPQPSQTHIAMAPPFGPQQPYGQQQPQVLGASSFGQQQQPPYGQSPPQQQQQQLPYGQGPPQQQQQPYGQGPSQQQQQQQQQPPPFGPPQPYGQQAPFGGPTQQPHGQQQQQQYPQEEQRQSNPQLHHSDAFRRIGIQQPPASGQALLPQPQPQPQQPGGYTATSQQPGYASGFQTGPTGQPVAQGAGDPQQQLLQQGQLARLPAGRLSNPGLEPPAAASQAHGFDPYGGGLGPAPQMQMQAPPPPYQQQQPQQPQQWPGPQAGHGMPAAGSGTSPLNASLRNSPLPRSPAFSRDGTPVSAAAAGAAAGHSPVPQQQVAAAAALSGSLRGAPPPLQGNSGAVLRPLTLPTTTGPQRSSGFGAGGNDGMIEEEMLDDDDEQPILTRGAIKAGSTATTGAGGVPSAASSTVGASWGPPSSPPVAATRAGSDFSFGGRDSQSVLDSPSLKPRVLQPVSRGGGAGGAAAQPSAPVPRPASGLGPGAKPAPPPPPAATGDLTTQDVEDEDF